MTGAGSLQIPASEDHAIASAQCARDQQAKRDAGGTVIWITGLSGAGKSTLARGVYDRLKPHHPNIVLLDGDAFREVIGDGLGHTRNDRLVNARRLMRLCRLLSQQGLHVICATMSLFRECHEWNRRHIPRYLEVYVEVPLGTLIGRDRKGLYVEAQHGRRQNVVGIDLSYDVPRCPDLVIRNVEHRDDLAEYVDCIIGKADLLHGTHFGQSRG